MHTVQHISRILPIGNAKNSQENYDAEYFRKRIPVLNTLDVTDDVIVKNRVLLLEHIRQDSICRNCKGFNSCGKEGDMRGFEQTLLTYGNQSELVSSVVRCTPYKESILRDKVQRYAAFSGFVAQDSKFKFGNFPQEQMKRHPKLYAYAREFAEKFTPGDSRTGAYLFGPPGVGKTHLLLAVLNRLKERGIACLIFRSDSVYDRMRHIIADDGDLEPMLEAFANVPVLGIDEFAQERANDFTMEKLFRVVNHRFHAGLPTWFTSNYSPPDIYKRNKDDVHDLAGPLRSRVMQMAILARVEGDDARQKNLKSLN